MYLLFPNNSYRKSLDTIYCKDESTFSELLRSLEVVTVEPILLDFQGKSLGSTDGDLSLLQIGLPTKTYVVDAVALDGFIPKIAPYLQSRAIRKVVWDGRLGYSELWHRYGIRLENVLDLQLVYLHERYDFAQRKCIPLSGKLSALKEKNMLSEDLVEIELKSIFRLNFSNVQNAVTWIRKHGDNAHSHPRSLTLHHLK